MSRVYYNHSFKLLILPHFSIQNQDMCRDTIGSSLIEIESQPNWNYGIL